MVDLIKKVNVLRPSYWYGYRHGTCYRRACNRYGYHSRVLLNNRHTWALPVTYEIIIMEVIVHHAVCSLIYNETSYIGLEVLL